MAQAGVAARKLAIAIIQFRDDIGSVQVGCSQNSETWWDTGYNLRMNRVFSQIGCEE